MYAVYLVDDEQLIREGLAETIPWESLELTLAGTAENGLQAFRDIQRLHPDIVVTDIRMPYMDGLELIQKLREAHLETRVVIISGYSEFTYAQSAIQLGVSDFILKPIDVQNLCRTLKRIVRELDGIEHQKNEVEEIREQLQQENTFRIQRALRIYMRGRIPQQQFLAQMPEEQRAARAAALVMVQIDNFDTVTAEMDEETIFQMTQQFEATVCQYKGPLHMIAFEESSGRYLMLFTGNDPEELRMEMRGHIRRKRLVGTDFDFTTVTSPVYGSITACQEAYGFVCRGSDYAFQLGTDRDIQPEEVQRSAAPLPEVPNVGRVIKSISTFNKTTIRKDFAALAEDIRQTGHNSFLYTHMLVSVVYGEIVKLLADISCPIESILENPTGAYRKILSCSTLDDMFAELYRFVAVICDFVENDMTASQSAAKRAKAYIEANYANSGLTLEQVAGAVSISPNYFSTLFKQSTGSSFINYLTDVRISHAKDMLRNRQLKTYEVATLCGYENPTYFSTIFKRRVGCSPSEYRENGDLPGAVI